MNSQKLYEIILRGICGERNYSYHIAARRIATSIEIELLSPQRRRIFDALESEAISTKLIANFLEMPSKNVSKQLLEMERLTDLIIKEEHDGIYYWKRKYRDS